MRERDVPDKEPKLPDLPAISPEAEQFLRKLIPDVGSIGVTKDTSDHLLIDEPSEEDLEAMAAFEARLNLDMPSLLKEMESNRRENVS